MGIRSAAAAAILLAGAVAGVAAATGGPGGHLDDVALAASPVDVWYEMNVGSGWPTAGDPTNVVETTLGSTYDQTYAMVGEGAYTAHVSESAVPFLYEHLVREVTESSGDGPTVGTVYDNLAGLPLIPGLAGAYPLFTGVQVIDPVLGSGQVFAFTPLLSALLYTDNVAGVEATLSIGGQLFTLFSFPVAGAEASPLAEAFADGLFGADVTSAAELTGLLDAF